MWGEGMNAKILYGLLGALLLSNFYLIYGVNEASRQARNAEFQARQAATAANNVHVRLQPQFQQLNRQLLERSSGGFGEAVSWRNMQVYSMSYQEILLEDIALKTSVDLVDARRTVKQLYRKQTGTEQPPGWTWVRQP